MRRGPRTAQGIAAVTRNIQRYNAERRKVLQRPAEWCGVNSVVPLQAKVRALAAQILALLEGEDPGIICPTDLVIIELLATALALTRLSQNGDLAAASRALSADSNRLPEAQETGKSANVQGDAPEEGAR